MVCGHHKPSIFGKQTHLCKSVWKSTDLNTASYSEVYIARLVCFSFNVHFLELLSGHVWLHV